MLNTRFTFHECNDLIFKICELLDIRIINKTDDNLDDCDGQRHLCKDSGEMIEHNWSMIYEKNHIREVSKESMYCVNCGKIINYSDPSFYEQWKSSCRGYKLPVLVICEILDLIPIGEIICQM